MLKDYKSPYGKPYGIFSYNRDYLLMVDTGSGYRYFHSTNWTHFEKDLATELTEGDFCERLEKHNARVNEM